MPRSLRLMFSGGVAVGLGLLAHSVQAQETKTDDSPQQMQRVEITGSSIKRITKEGALPVQTLTKEDIAKTGAQSVADLVQALPAMQGFVPSSNSVNGSGAGVETASIHSLGSGYTLVLLNGRRMAKSAINNNDYAVNLASIPLAAVERVEILTDGASALYGSDAIAGVVNFILKKNSTSTDVTATYNAPTKAGGKSFNVGISKGFGDLDKDGYNVLLAYSHDEQKNLVAGQRGFASSGVV
ncbi:TonB-dependent receptor plug domain-containing protein, partial [Collimonas sp.]|uniref:TonB-dependent receptor plug domain-containing protein n=1 Tax=Collimonas sp. TaxID=1963772 RepID=UPI002CA10099